MLTYIMIDDRIAHLGLVHKHDGVLLFEIIWDQQNFRARWNPFSMLSAYLFPRTYKMQVIEY